VLFITDELNNVIKSSNRFAEIEAGYGEGK